MDETFILLLLADSNLPTGSFVASSGLESYTTHGFLSLEPTKTEGTLAFVRDSLHSYAHSALPFTSDAHGIVAALAQLGQDTQQALASLTALDALYESMTVNHVARRASTAQGTALLALYAKAFSSTRSSSSAVMTALVDQLKLAARRGDTYGHLPVCWGVLTAALGLSLGRAQHLALFLHARSILSAAVRLNTIGPYLSQQILLMDIQPLVDGLVAQCCNLRSETDLDLDLDEGGHTTGPASTWPLGDIIAIRHDLQHSRIFNS
ncbi:hypothetical protein SCLCIDRAFT_13658 [Scleroderma citrinum Foug A]|uniref:Urease accessory protein UreF n=1 Tax=Scleroderma citrinum Foug A TaxID=1036808 RepID=A0A0C3AVH5_9AGAM|nr:hypothetical protein SCLCIDRAFT_13658 [Scleroderma citrinum Foug A]